MCLDKRGRPQFRDLLFHRGEPCFYAFDLLMNDGKDIADGEAHRSKARTQPPTD